MTAPVTAYALLALALAAAFAWYERSRPSGRVVALAAALAALAVIGRIAFAPIPNVKPTTDIVLFAGYVLGGPAGFAVGAVTAFVSNVFFGQGPWTPWQMAGWGAVGVGGALLARVTGHRPLGRWTLAAACALAGAGFGVLMDLHLWTLSAERTLAGWLAISAVSLPFNAAHVAGNVAFCLLAGPTLIALVSRVRTRFAVDWPAPPTRPAAAGLGPPAALVIALVSALALLAAPAATAASSSERAVRYLKGAQNADGGFGGAPREGSTQLHTAWTALGLAAAGQNPRDVSRRGRSVVEYTRAHAGQLGDSGELERTILVLRAAGLSPRRFAGRDLVADLRKRRRRDGSWEGATGMTAYGVLALRAGGASTRDRAVRGAASWLLRRQNDDGGWGLAGGSPSDVDITGAVLQALDAAGRGRASAARRGVAYIRGAQNRDGGFGQAADVPSNAQSTAWAVQGLVAAGRNPERLRKSGRTPLGYLRSLQSANGSVRYSRTSAQTPVWVTGQALVAFERATFPLRPVARRRAARRPPARRAGATAVAARAAPRRPARRPAAAGSRARPDEEARASGRDRGRRERGGRGRERRGGSQRARRTVAGPPAPARPAPAGAEAVEALTARPPAAAAAASPAAARDGDGQPLALWLGLGGAVAAAGAVVAVRRRRAAP